VRVALVFVVVSLAAPPAVADPPRPGAALRVSAAYGWCEEKTWEYPSVDLVGELAFEHGFLALSIGYAPFDNHTFLADGRSVHSVLAGGVIADRTRVGVAAGLDSVSFHADPDVLTEHPGVDLLASRHQVVPTLGIELGYRVADTIELGVFGTAALTELDLFDTPTGDTGSARYVLGGLYADFRIR